MKSFKISLAIAGFMFGMGIGLAFAAEEPTVTLTQAELQAVINAQIAASQAAPAFKKVQGAFTPPPAPIAHPTPAAEPAK
jgi:uncharacterized membrane protein YedE/YeeE